MAGRRLPPDREIVRRFVEHLRSRGYPDLRIDSWPEDDHPGQSVVEAIAGNLAIEHTSVDTLPDQRRIGEQLMETLAILERLPVPAQLNITVPYDLVTVGADWQAYRLALANWIINISPGLQDGEYEIAMPGTALKCISVKESGRTPAIFLSRPVQEDATLAQRVGQQIARKMKKLRRYKDEAYDTVLILETQDQSLMNQHKMLKAVHEVVGGAMPDGLDQLWFTEARGTCFFDFATPLRAGSDVLE